MSVISSKQSEDSRRKRVDPASLAVEFLDPERLETANLKLNNNGKRTLGRFTNDNKQVMFTDYGKIIALRNDLAHYEVRGRGKHKKRVLVVSDVGKLVDYVVTSWEKFYESKINFYDPVIIQLYNAPSKMNPRSIFLHKKYWKRLASYGVNVGKDLPNIIVSQIKAYLDEHYMDYFSNSRFEFDLEEEFKKGKWLTHITTGSNSGYPYNIPQDKQWMYNVVMPKTLKALEAFIKGGPNAVNWKKFLFSLGSRNERGLSQRFVAMAPAHEKPIGALINELLDEDLERLPIQLPRKFGSFDNLAKEFLSTKGVYVAKDFDAFDTRILIAFFLILAKWFMSLNNTIGYLIAFECYLMANAYVIVGPKLLYFLASLPSGIGLTQVIGSIIHELADALSGLLEYLKKYVWQSDDTLGKGDITKREAEVCFNWIEKNLFMKISPLGKKSLINDSVGLVLQKIIWDEKDIYFTHEARAHTNRLLRERRMNTDDKLALRLGIDLTNKKEKGNLIKIQGVRSLLGNISSYGVNAPLLPEVLYTTYGLKATTYDVSQLNIGLNALKDWQEEEHKLPMANDWLKAFYEEAVPQYGWNKVSTKISIESIENILRSYGRKL